MADHNKDISSYGEEAQAYIKELREEAKTNRLKASEFEGKVTERDAAITAASSRIDELTEKAKTADTLQDQYAQAIAQKASAELNLTRMTAAIDAGLPPSFATRLQGESADALKADAEAFKASLATNAPGTVTFDRTKGKGESVPELDPIRSAIQNHLLSQENSE